jgi:MFS family permease
MSKLIKSAIWKNRNFTKLWAGLSISYIGTSINSLALPTLAVMVLGYGAKEVGLLKTVETLSFPLLGLFVGVMADRYNPRYLMIIADLVRFLAIISIPILAYFDVLSLYHLFIIAALTGVFSLIFNVSYMTMVPSIVKKEMLAEGNAKLTLIDSASKVMGPTIAGWIINILGAVKAFLFDAFTYLISALFLIFIKHKPEKSKKKKNTVFKDINEGLKFVFGNKILKSLTISLTFVNLGYALIQTIIVVFAYKNLMLSPSQVGIIFSISSIGLIIGALVSKKVIELIGIGKSLFLSSGFLGLSLGLIPLSDYVSPIITFTLLWTAGSLFLPILDVNQVTLRQSITPTHLQGRMNATIRTFMWGATPLGALLGGTIGDLAGMRIAFIVGGVCIIIGTLIIFFSEIMKVKSISGNSVLKYEDSTQKQEVTNNRGY